MATVYAVTGVPSSPQLPVAEVVTRWLPFWLFVILLLPLVGNVLLLYLRDRQLVPRSRGWLLTSLRALLVLLLLLLLLDLARVNELTMEQPGEVLIIADVSASMGLLDSHRTPRQQLREAEALGLTPAQLRGLSRLDLVKRALRSEWTEELSRRHRLTWLRVAAQALPIEGVEYGKPSLEGLEATGQQTDLGQPILEEVLRRERDSVSAVILFSDGNHHAPRDPRQVARTLGVLKVPVLAIGVGAAEKPRDVAIVSVDAGGTVFAGDDVKVELSIESVAMSPRTLPVELREGDKVIERFELTLPAGDGVTRWPLQFVLEEPGRRRLTVSFPPQEGEASGLNNRRDFWIDVLSEEAKVLYVDGGPRWEYIYLRAALTRQESVKADVFLVSPPPDRRLPQGFPRDREGLFAYDMIVLGDVEPGLFTTDETQMWGDFVRARGGTLVVLSGWRAMPYAWAASPLLSLLPVELRFPPPSSDLGVQLARSGLPLRLTPEGEVSPLLRLVAGRGRNLELWELLPPQHWFVPVEAVKPGSEILATLELPRGAPGAEAVAPAFVTRVLGAGKVF